MKIKKMAIAASVFLFHAIFFAMLSRNTTVPPKKMVVNTITITDYGVGTSKKRGGSVSVKREISIKGKIKEAEKILKGIEKNKNDISGEINIPKKIKNKIDSDFEKDNYISLLTEYFKENLSFPEHGNVKLKLILLANGCVEELNILSYENETNKNYLEKKLRQLKFPPIKNLQNKKKYNFILTFCNDPN